MEQKETILFFNKIDMFLPCTAFWDNATIPLQMRG